MVSFLGTEGLGMLEIRKEDPCQQRHLKMLENEGKLGVHVSMGGGRSVGS